MPDNNFIGKTIEEFRIERFLGQGGMAAVYEATDTRLQRQVAVKVMHPHLASQDSFRERFLNEAHAAASLDHPNIVRVMTFNKDTDNLYLVMELITGGNLRQYVKQLHEQGKFIDYPEAIEIVRQLAGALHYAHGRRMIHRDIKPDNIMLKPLKHEEAGLNYRPVITDFGLAKLNSSTEDAITAEQPIGTYPYMSPEQINADNVDQRTDIYALGIMLYELSVGRLPYNPKSIAEAARMHGREPLPLPTELRRGFPIRLEEIIVKALEKNAEERYQSAASMAKALSSFKEEKKFKTLELNRQELFTYMDQFDTDVQTSIISEPLAPLPPVAPEEQKLRDKEYDCLYFTNGEANFYRRLVRERTTIGRDKRQDISIDSPFISRQHAVLERKPNGKYYLLDISESNGTWTHDSKLKKDTPVILQSQTVIRMGDFWVQFFPKIDDETDPGIWIEPPPVSKQAPEPKQTLAMMPVVHVPEPESDVEDTPEPIQSPDIGLGELGKLETKKGEDIRSAVSKMLKDAEEAEEAEQAKQSPAQESTQEDLYEFTPPLANMALPSDYAAYEQATMMEVDPEDIQAAMRAEAERQRREKAGEPPIQSAIPKASPPPQRQSNIPSEDRIRGAGGKDVESEMEKLLAEAEAVAMESGGIGDTKLLGIVPLNEMPRDEPPALTPAQFGFDRLVIFHKGDEPRLILLENNEYSLGRDESNHIVLDSQHVSKHHATIEFENGFYQISDHKSTNGTWFENERLQANTPTRLNASKTMRVGDFWLTFEAKRDVGGDILSSGIELRQTSTPDQSYDDSIETAVMVRELDPEMPHYSDMVMSNEMRSSDRLVFYSDDHPMQFIAIDREVITIGRGSNQQVRLEGKRVSREHAILEVRRDGNLYLTDVGSSNGVWVSDTLLVPNTQVLWGKNEIARVGNYWLKFEAGTHIVTPGGLQDQRGLIGKTIGAYRIDRYIGRSAMSSVYKASDLQLDRDVGLRILDPRYSADASQRQRFLEEARILSRLDHPNIVKVMSYNRADNEVFMVMELISGGNLRAVIDRFAKQGTQIELRDAVDIIIQLANGLHFAHQQGLMHRDVKPDNIVLKTTGIVGPLVKYTPVLTDFSIARFARTEDIFEDESPTSLAYISPEALMGERTDIRSDIYELGIVLFELMVGYTPYAPQSVSEAIRMHTREALPRVSERRPDIPIDLEAIVNKAMNKSQNDRYQTGIDMARALQRLIPILDSDNPSDISLQSLSQDVNATLIMPNPLPRAMPLLTHPPREEGEALHDRLILYSEQYPTKVFELNKPIFTIGRNDDQDISLESNKVSRRHARLERSPDYIYRIVDIGSTNGSWLGSYRLVENVLEIWDTEETVRLADYWLRIETKEELNAEYAPLIIEEEPEEELALETVARPPAIHHPAPQHDRIQVTTNTNIVAVAPGSTATISVEVVNLNDFVDHFIVEAVGLPPDWVTQPPATLDLLPNNRETTSITFHPPLTTTSTAGNHAFEIRVTAQAKGISAVRTQCTLVIQPFHRFETSLYPDRVRNKGRVELTLRNTSNTFNTFKVEARDREQMLRFQLEGKQYSLPPGHTESIIIGVNPVRRPLFGQQQNLLFEVMITPVPPEIAGGVQTQRGDLLLTSRFRVWWFIVLFILLLLCGIISALLAYSAYSGVLLGTQTAIVQATNDVAATQTAAVGQDDDGDGLSNLKEAEYGTFPNLKDTDEDGLSDGEEVRIWNSDPLNRDSDNDTISDGDEVARGLNPNNPDTDGDGIPDAQDSFPGQMATPTITPFPTIPGTDGEICPNSPSPSQLFIGVQARVTEGGVPNRIRSEPSFNSGEIVGYMDPLVQFTVIGGPTCDPETSIRYWQVDFNGLQGWSAEGEGDEFYLEPLPTGDDNTDTSSADASTDESEATSAVMDTLSSIPPAGTIALNRSAIGIQMNADMNNTDWQNAIDYITPLGMGWIKLQANWKALQPNGPGITSELQTLQANIQIAKNQGYRVLVSIAKAPTWTRTNPVQDGPPDNLADLDAFLATLLELSGTNIDAIEVWNEPNLKREWHTDVLPMTGTGYMALFHRAYTVIRAYSADIVLVTAGLAPTGNTDISVQDRKFLRQMYNNGLAGYQNVAIGVHPYGWANAPDAVCCNPSDGRAWDDQPQFFFLNTLVTYHTIMASYGHDSELWVSEFGWSTWNDLPLDPPEAWMNYLTPQEQIAYTLHAFEIGSALEYVGPMFLWNFNFANQFNINNRSEMVGFSLVISDNNNIFQPRALFNALMQ